MCLLLICSTNVAAASFQKLSDLTGGQYLKLGNYISSDGSIIAGNYNADSSNESAYWSSETGLVILENHTGNQADAYCNAISADGTTIVGLSTHLDGRNEAYVWTAETGIVRLGFLNGIIGSSEANGASADGSIVIGDSSVKVVDPDTGYETSLGREAFIWTAESGMVSLGSLIPDDYWSFGSSISADGTTVVGNSRSNGGYEAFRWTSETGMQGLGDLAGGDYYSNAYGVSDDGSTIVGYSTSGEHYEAFKWTEESGMVGLGFLDGGDMSVASAVSGDGSVVIGRGSLNGFSNAFIWKEELGMLSFQSYLESLGLDLSGWRLYDATSISYDGNTIVGYGRNPDGIYEAWIATVPEPSTISILAIGLLTLSKRRRK